MPDLCTAENLRRFHGLVMSRLDLLGQLREVREREAFIELMVRLGVEQKLPFSRGEVVESLRARRRGVAGGAMTPTIEQLIGWTPIRVFLRGEQFLVDWAWLGEVRFREPFFEDTIRRALHDPATLLFRQETPIEMLEEFAVVRPGLKPSGFVFHMSRCGSTLIPQMLAALAQNLAISEAGPVDTILRAHYQVQGISEEQRIRWLRGIVNALGQGRHGESHYVIKFDSWHTLFLPTILKAFPDVPWIFLYRNPVEVMVSQQVQRGMQMVPGLIHPELFGMRREEVCQLSLDEYCAGVLERICGAALEAAGSKRGMLVNFRDLPRDCWVALLQHWGLEFTAEETERMFEATKFHAKNPHLPYEDDVASKHKKATEEIRRLCRERLTPLFEALERGREKEESEDEVRRIQ